MEKESALWRKVNEEEKEKIKRDAKKIMDDFSRALEKIGKQEESFVEREQDRRIEKEGDEPDSEFRKIMFKNAPQTKNECIEAEKGEWT